MQAKQNEMQTTHLTMSCHLLKHANSKLQLCKTTTWTPKRKQSWWLHQMLNSNQFVLTVFSWAKIRMFEVFTVRWNKLASFDRAKTCRSVNPIWNEHTHDGWARISIACFTITSTNRHFNKKHLHKHEVCKGQEKLIEKSPRQYG